MRDDYNERSGPRYLPPAVPSSQFAAGAASASETPNLASRAQDSLFGARVLYAFVAVKTSRSRRFSRLLFGGARIVAVTDREIVVMDGGRTTGRRSRPKAVLYRVPRTSMQPRPTRAGAMIDLDRERLFVPHGVRAFISHAEAWAAGEGPPPRPSLTPTPGPARAKRIRAVLILAALLGILGLVAVIIWAPSSSPARTLAGYSLALVGIFTRVAYERRHPRGRRRGGRQRRGKARRQRPMS
jgi:hypothetical protein